MENIKLEIRERYHAMSKAEKRISDFVLANAADCLGMTAVDIAAHSEVSSASIIRYVQKLGFDGLEGFKLALAAANSQDQDHDWNVVDPIISKTDSLETLCTKMENMVEGALGDLFYQLDYRELERAIRAIRGARRIYLLGIGASMLPAYDLFHKLKRADFDAGYYSDLNMVTEFLHYVDERDLVIAFSYSGQSKEVLYPCEAAKQRKAAIIAVTRNGESPLRKLADISLLVPNRESVTRIGAFTSVHTSIMMGDLMYMGAIQENLEEIEVHLIETRKLVEGLKMKD